MRHVGAHRAVRILLPDMQFSLTGVTTQPHPHPHSTPPHPTTPLWYRTLTIYWYSHYKALSAMDMLNICPVFISVLYQDTLLWAFCVAGAEEWRCIDKASGSWRFERFKYFHLQDYRGSRTFGFLKIRKPIIHWGIAISCSNRVFKLLAPEFYI